MKIEHLTNDFTNLGSELSAQLSRCSTFCIGTAFIGAPGIELIETCLKKNSSLKSGQLLIGVYGCFNLKSDLLRLHALVKKYSEKFQVNISTDKSFHWKYYQFESRQSQTAYVGSANLTTGGLGNNGEMVLKLTARKGDGEDAIEKLGESFAKQWEKSRSIADFPFDYYPESKRANSNIAANREFNEFFKPKLIRSKIKEDLNDNAVVYYLTHEISKATENKLYGYMSDWKKDKQLEIFVCKTKKHFEACKDANNVLLFFKESRNDYSYCWVKVMDACDSIKTDDGNYFIAYKAKKREKKLNDSQLNILATDFGIRLNAIKEPFVYKVLRRKQVEIMEALL